MNFTSRLNKINGGQTPFFLTHAIERLHLDPAWARQLGLAARARAVAEFDERIVIAKPLAVYAELVGSWFVVASAARQSMQSEVMGCHGLRPRRDQGGRLQRLGA